jgi:hypothetical protein
MYKHSRNKLKLSKLIKGICRLITEAPIRKPLVIGDKVIDITVDVATPVEGTNKQWWTVFSIALMLSFGS